MSKQLRSHQIETVVDEPLGLSNGDIATLYISGENVARVSIVQVGKCDMTVKWGSAVVKPGKAIISLDEVYFPSVRPVSMRLRKIRFREIKFAKSRESRLHP